MVEKIVKKIAEHRGLILSDVSLVDGQRIGCADASLLKIRAHGQLVCALIYKYDLDQIVSGYTGDIENRVQSALSKLLVMVESEKSS